MKHLLSEAVVEKIMAQLVERFGEPITQGTVKLVTEATTCNECGGMMEIEQGACTSCGAMPTEMPAEETSTAIVVVGGRKNPRGTQPGATNGNIAAGVHPPKDMDIPPEAEPKKGKPSGPVAAPSRPVSESKRRKRS